MDTQNKTASRSNMVQRGHNVPKHQTKRPSVRKIYHSRGRLNVSTSTHIKEPNHKGRQLPSTFRVLPGLIWQHITTRHAFRMKYTRFSFNRKAEASRQDDKNIIATIRHVFQQKGDEMAKMKCEGSNGITNRL